MISAYTYAAYSSYYSDNQIFSIRLVYVIFGTHIFFLYLSALQPTGKNISLIGSSFNISWQCHHISSYLGMTSVYHHRIFRSDTYTHLGIVNWEVSDYQMEKVSASNVDVEWHKGMVIFFLFHVHSLKSWCHISNGWINYFECQLHHWSSNFNSSNPGAAYMSQWIGAALVQIIACRLFGAKQWCELMQGCCWLHPLEHNLMKL